MLISHHAHDFLSRSLIHKPQTLSLILSVNLLYDEVMYQFELIHYPVGADPVELTTFTRYEPNFVTDLWSRVTAVWPWLKEGEKQKQRIWSWFITDGGLEEYFKVAMATSDARGGLDGGELVRNPR